MKKHLILTETVLLVATIVFVFVLTASGTVHGASLIGAEAAIEKIRQDSTVEAAATPADKTELEMLAFKQALESYRKTKDTKPAETAAAEWLALVENLWRLSSADEYFYRNNEERMSFATLFNDIPGPEAWGRLVSLAEDKKPGQGAQTLRVSGLKLVAYFLNGDYGKIEREFKTLQRIANQTPGYHKVRILELIKGLKLHTKKVTSMNSPDDILNNYQEMLADESFGGKKDKQLNLPDLITLAGRQKARELILQTIEKPGVTIAVPSGGDTLGLVKRLILEHMDKLHSPQWKIIDSIDDVALYEAMERRFPVKAGADADDIEANVFADKNSHFEAATRDGRDEVRPYYLAGLVALGRLKEAVDYAINHRGEYLQSGRFAGARLSSPRRDLTAKMFDYYDAVLKAKPEADLWSEYVAVAIASEKTTPMFEAINQTKQAGDTGPVRRLQLAELQAMAHLALDKLDAAYAVIQNSLALTVENETANVQLKVEEKKQVFGNMLADLGMLLGKPQWADQGLSAIIRSYKIKQALASRDNYQSYDAYRICDQLIRAKQYARAEAFAVSTMTDRLREHKKENPLVASTEAFDLSRGVTLLLEIYHHAGRHEDVLNLLQKAPWWTRKDLSHIYDDDVRIAAAQALHALGRDSEAEVIVKSCLLDNPENDKAYQLLADVSTQDLIPWLDELYSRDRFEERPLIWKAYALNQSGRHKEAEKVIKQALKIDPTDGEQKAGDRIRSYSVYADILTALGDEEQAAFFRNVVESVRLAEKGDELKQAHLIKRSLSFYERAEDLFADAYCVQWRLAERLFEMGDYKAADQHYQIAFERMPEQFGRVASFCFGCQGVFNKQHSKSMAEKVLLRLEKTDAQRPQVHFLMGQLREAQGRYSDAHTSYKRSVELDPEYLDAMKKIFGLRDNLFLPQEELDELTFRILAIDPSGKHSSYDINDVAAIDKLWRVLEKNAELTTRPIKTLLELPASKEAIVDFEVKMNQVSSGRFNYDKYIAANLWRQRRKPGEIIAQHNVVQAANNLMEIGESMDRQSF